MNYGIPYKGSKSQIADWILANLPKRKNLYDLFGGGGAITHRALLSNKFERVHYNEINGLKFRQACEFAPSTALVERAEFHASKDIKVRALWSFSNNLKEYFVARELEHLAFIKHNFVFYKHEISQKALEDFAEYPMPNVFFCDEPSERVLLLADFLTKHESRFKRNYTNYYLKEHLHAERVDAQKIDHNTLKGLEFALRQYLRRAQEKSGITLAEINRLTNTYMAGHWFRDCQWSFPARDQYETLQNILPGLVRSYDDCTAPLKVARAVLKIRNYRINRFETYARYCRMCDLHRTAKPQLYKLTETHDDYRAVPIDTNSVIYCDIPYMGSDEYYGKGANFDFEAFFQWANEQTEPVIVSSYQLPKEFFTELVAVKKLNLLSKNRKPQTEALFIPNSQIGKFIYNKQIKLF